MVKLTLKEKNEYIEQQMKKYDEDDLPSDIKKNVKKYVKELNDNTDKLEEILINFFIDKTITEKMYDKILKLIWGHEIFSLDEIPELKKADSKSDKENKKPLTVTQQNNLIRKIPDYVFTEAEILKIVEHIRNGTMTKVSQMPNPTKKEPKVPLNAVVLDKRK